MLEIPAALFDEMIAHAESESPNECCGFLVGHRDLPSRVIRLKNALASPREFSADANDLFAAHRSMRELGLELLAIYHSHPYSAARPSRRDLAENNYEELPQIIISLADTEPVLKAFRLAADSFEELDVRRSARELTE